MWLRRVARPFAILLVGLGGDMGRSFRHPRRCSELVELVDLGLLELTPLVDSSRRGLC